MKIPKHKNSVHICLLNGKWRAILYGTRNRMHLNAAFMFCKKKNATESRQ